jgi:hypothetical protein
VSLLQPWLENADDAIVDQHRGDGDHRGAWEERGLYHQITESMTVRRGQ